MTDNGKQRLDRIGQILPKLSELNQERWLSYGEGLAVSLPEQRGAQVLLLGSDVTDRELQEA